MVGLTVHGPLVTWRPDPALTRAVERLSTGLRVSRAGDDAAGLGIARALGGQESGWRVGARGARDAIVAMRVSEGVLAHVHGVLHRVRDLAVAAMSTGSRGPGAQTALDEEARVLLEDLDRAAAGARLGGRPVLGGAFTASLQVGPDSGDTVPVSVPLDATRRGLGLAGLSLTGRITGATSTTGNADFGGHPGTPSTFTVDVIDDAAVMALVAALADPATAVSVDGAVVDLTGVQTLTDLVTALDGAGGARATWAAGWLTVTAAQTGPAPVVVTGLTGTPSLGTADVPDSGGTSASLTGRVDLERATGIITSSGGARLDLWDVADDIRAAGDDQARAETLAAALGEAFAGTVAHVDPDGTFTLTATAHADEMFSVEEAAPGRALALVDAAIASVSTTRAYLGATESRLIHAGVIADTAAENLAHAVARILDVDMAAAAAELAGARVRAGVAVAAQSQAGALHRSTIAALLAR